MVSYAIDFGTSNTVITRWNAVTQQPETIKLSGICQQLGNNPPLIPSLLYVENASQAQVLVGQKVRDCGLDLSNNPRFFRSFKRGIGAKIQGFLPELDQTIITFEQVGEWFLNTLIQQLHNQSVKPLESLVLTVPVDSFENYRHWLSQVCQGWEIEQIRLLDEPTAAALGYGTTEEDLLLVVDFGGGTLDLSLVQLDAKNKEENQGFILKWGQKLLGESASQKVRLARVLAKAGMNLGGSDIDDWLINYFSKTQNLSKSSLTLRLAERLKIKLSSQTEAQEVHFNDETLDSYELVLNREQFETILKEQQFFAQLDELMSQVLQQARRNGIEKTDINKVLLVGGTVKIPAVQTWVKQYFDESKIKCDRPFEAIAQGALQLAQGFEVKDFLYHSYGIRYWNRRKNCHDWHPIIKSGQSYPMNKPIEIKLGASIENQPSIELIIGELGAEIGGTEVYFEGDRLVTRSRGNGETNVQALNDRDGGRNIAQLDPIGSPGSDRIKLQFWVDEQRFLRINVEDLLTQNRLTNNQIVAQLS
ncbi:Hsp70 family protein [Aphanothece sacrum]|uniref:Chaperon protein Hsp70 n=1 Tax=Aphanothece sacrum FPU1 TaxID=1920663 RepID=A0A401IBN7_APHSA|nr:Hsp70 family protein [Aphanothece sacrum]GBF78659.1 chaperon protein Hsp70 [Aphanothece sacrum FPU1]GBF84948.1 Hsp70-like protein [Aphanothece sacrum FPU3]